MDNASIKLMTKSVFEFSFVQRKKSVFESSFVHAQNEKSTQKDGDIFNQILFFQEVDVLKSDSFFDAESVHFIDTTKHVDPNSYADAMSSPDAKLWKEAFDKEMNGNRS